MWLSLDLTTNFHRPSSTLSWFKFWWSWCEFSLQAVISTQLSSTFSNSCSHLTGWHENWQKSRSLAKALGNPIHRFSRALVFTRRLEYHQMHTGRLDTKRQAKSRVWRTQNVAGNPGYAELDKNGLQGRNTTDDNSYQKLQRRD